MKTLVEYVLAISIIMIAVGVILANCGRIAMVFNSITNMIP